MRQTGTHSFSISDGGDPTNVWSSDFRLHGWLDDLYGAAAVSVFDPEDRDAWHFPTEVIDATYLYVGRLKHYFLFGIYGESKSRYMIFKIYQRYLYHISLWSYVTVCWSICWVLGSQNSGIGAGAWDGLSIGGWPQAALGDLGRSGLWNGWAGSTRMGLLQQDLSLGWPKEPRNKGVMSAAMPTGHQSWETRWWWRKKYIWNLYESLTYKQFHSDV